jgi:HD-GYP domain-containing protein (c-di-GMP phosphodiesterase class II)
VKLPPLRLTFLVRFTIVTALVSIVCAIVLALSVEDVHRRAVQRDLEVAALGRINAELTRPLDELAASGKVTPEIAQALDHINNDSKFFQYVTGLRIYRPSGQPAYPPGGAPDRSDVHRALAADDVTMMEHGDITTALSPIFTKNEQTFVLAIDLSKSLEAAQFDKERQQILAVTGGVVLIIFLSLVTLAAGASRELERRRRESQSSFVQTLRVMAETIDLRDPYTAGHSRRVGDYSRKLALALNLPARRVDVIENAALLHDLGKIAVPDAVLFKPAYLDARERAMIGTHPTVGAKLLSGIASMEDIVPCVLHHHEKIDGSGYPDRLLGPAIPEGARAIAVADAFDAMTTDRPYRRALSADAAVAELRRVAGTQLDATMVEAFCTLVARGEIVPPRPSDDRELMFGRASELRPSEA